VAGVSPSFLIRAIAQSIRFCGLPEHAHEEGVAEFRFLGRGHSAASRRISPHSATNDARISEALASNWISNSLMRALQRYLAASSPATLSLSSIRATVSNDARRSLALLFVGSSC
jgi:hypothetical protein